METTDATTPVPTAPRPSWRDQEPPYLYTAKWHDATGIEHLLCIREDHMDSLLAQVKILTAMIRKSQQAHTPAPADPPAAPAEAVTPPWCATHQVPYQRQSKGGRSWWSHFDTTSQQWCKPPKA